ncbi:MAG: cation:proton antiporter [Bacteroidota bacterium]
MLSQKLKVAYPIILVIAGLLIGMMPGVPVTGIDPELIFLIFLPPLLYDAAWNTSWKKFWYCRRAIFSFASIFILITSLVVALISSALIPGFTLAIGFLLGGIVSPPDAVSAASVFKNTKVPKNIATVVEGESLLNDASSLIVLRFALIAVDSGRFVFHKAAINFTIVIVMGIALGIVIGFIYYLVHSRLRTTANIDTVLMLTAPFVMYLVAEQFHISGVLSVVSGGLFLSSKRHFYLNHSSRRHGANVWSSIGLILNGLVFMLIGLELPNIVGQLGSHNIPIAIWYGLLISFVLIISRIIAAFVTSASTTFISQYITTSYSRPGWKKPLLFGWVGMRGVVSLAGALSLPVYLSNGTALPQRNLILFITFVVILVTLIFQGLTLPWLIRKLNIQADDEINPHGQRSF